MANSLFAIQVFLPLQPNDTLRRQLRKLILAAPENAELNEKRRGYESIVRALLSASGQFTQGNWDFTDDPDEAESEFESWCSGTESDAKAREAQRSSSAGSEPRFMFVTLAFLMQSDEACALQLAEASDLQEADLWKRATFVELLETVLRLDFVSMVGDAVYLCPGELEFGLTGAELAEEGYDYLHRIE